MNDLSIYRLVRPQIRPGDVIAFGGAGVISSLIKFLTRSSVSHVGVVLEAVDVDGEREIRLFESTTLTGKSGVQINRLSERLANYDGGGRAWWLPLSERSRSALDLVKMYSFAIQQMGDGYDAFGLAKFLLREIPGAGMAFHRPDPRREFCSELVAQLFQEAGLLHGIDTYETTPQRLCEMSIWEKSIQLMGQPNPIRRFNTV
jgi:hypothetical protein